MPIDLPTKKNTKRYRLEFANHGPVSNRFDNIASVEVGNKSTAKVGNTGRQLYNYYSKREK